MKFNPSTSSGNIPKEVIEICKKLEEAGFEAHLVGGCVRDLILGREPKDWDITTNAKPEQVQKIFKDSVYENQFGTVGVKTESEDPKLKIIEITTYRIEGKYTDKRHPDEIRFAKTVEEDLARRDFTINAMALSLSTKHEARKSKQILNSKNIIQNEKVSDFGFRILDLWIVDPFGGIEDLKNKIIRAVGDPEQRFSEDALRLMRAVRFAAELGFKIEAETENAIKKLSGLLEMIAKERIRDEFIKIIMSNNAAQGIQMLEDFGLLKYIAPELREGIGVTQDRHHIYTVWEHNLRSLEYTVKKKYGLEIRLAALFHDIGKPKTKAGKTPNSTFYNHEIVGARITAKILDRLNFSKAVSAQVVHLVRYHMFYYNVGDVTEAGVRRFLVRVGPENVDDLIKVREADRIGSGVPKAVPYKLRHLLFMIDKVKKDPILPKMLKLNGSELMKLLKITPGPRVGWILNILLEEVLDDPKRNEKDYLSARAGEFEKLSDKELKDMSEKAKVARDEFEGEVEKEIKNKYRV